MLQTPIDFTLYTIWANDRLIQDLSAQSEVLLTRKVVSSFPSIKATATHIWYAETGWLSRLQGLGWQVEEVTEFSGTALELFSAWQKTSKAFAAFAKTADLAKNVDFEHKGEVFSIPAKEIIQTVCNHGSFHRGQIVTMLRQFNITQITQTDYIEWVREKERARWTS